MHQLIRYLLVGTTAAAVNIGVLYVAVHVFDIWYITAAAIAFCCSVTTSYLLQKFWTFKDHSLDGVHVQFALFLGYALLMLGLNALLLYIEVDVIGIWYILAQAITLALLAFINYQFFSKIVFK